jgi:hypothetical protein
MTDLVQYIRAAVKSDPKLIEPYLNGEFAKIQTCIRLLIAGRPQAVDNVHDTTPTAAELTAAFGSPETLGRGFIGTVDDADGDTNGYICWTSDASWYFLKGTKAL